MLRKQILLLGKQKMFLPGVKNIFASRTQIVRPKHMFPSLTTPGNITRNIVSATLFLSLARPSETYFQFHSFTLQTAYTNLNFQDSSYTRTLCKQKDLE